MYLESSYVHWNLTKETSCKSRTQLLTSFTNVYLCIETSAKRNVNMESSQVNKTDLGGETKKKGCLVRYQFVEVDKKGVKKNLMTIEGAYKQLMSNFVSFHPRKHSVAVSC